MPSACCCCCYGDGGCRCYCLGLLPYWNVVIVTGSDPPTTTTTIAGQWKATRGRDIQQQQVQNRSCRRPESMHFIHFGSIFLDIFHIPSLGLSLCDRKCDLSRNLDVISVFTDPECKKIKLLY